MRTSYDLVVVGAGTAGCVVASRLSEDPSRQVLLVEAGGDYVTAEPPAVVRGVNWRDTLAVPDLQWGALTARLTADQEPVPYARGRGTGGSTLVNAMIANRGAPGDYDAWAAAGADGWTFDDVLPSFRRLEDDPELGDRPHRGRGGPMPIWRPGAARRGSVDVAFAEAARDTGHAEGDDDDEPGASGLFPTAFSCRDGVRVTAADAYLRPAAGRPNLTLLPCTVADRLVLTGNRVTGVRLRTGGDVRDVGAGDVVLAAGSVNSPVLLQRSGIGPAEELRRIGVDVVADLPGVGANLADHPVMWVHLPLVPDARAASLDAWPLGHVLRFSSAALGVTDGDDGADDHDGAGATADPDDLLALSLNYAGMGTDALLTGRLYVSLFRPRSVGRLRLRSLDPAVPPDIDVGMLTDPRDLERLRVGLRHVLALAAHPSIRAISNGIRIGVRAEPLPAPADDAALDRALLTGVASFNHVAGTCRMGHPGDDGVVVGPDGRVVGVDGLRVVDASVMPALPRANTAIPTVMIGEHLSRRIEESP